VRRGPTFVLYESLLVLKIASRALRLTDGEPEVICHGNGAGLYGLPA